MQLNITWKAGPLSGDIGYTPFCLIPSSFHALQSVGITHTKGREERKSQIELE